MDQLRPIPPTGYMRLSDILLYFPVSKSTWWKGVASGSYPRGVKLSQRCTAWRAEDIASLLARQGVTP